MTIDIYAADEQTDHEIDLERWVALCRAALIEEQVKAPAEVSLIFCDEATIAELNEQFMGKTGPTDVLSFPIDAEPEPTGRVPDDHEVSFDDEVALLIVHGVLHLRGWDHMIDDEAERMEAREREILARHYRSNDA